MKIDVETSRDAATVTLIGSLIAGEDLRILRDTIDDLLRRGYRRIVLDLSEVPTIDSNGLGEIVRTYTTVRQEGGTLTLLGLKKYYAELLSGTRPTTPVAHSNSPRPDSDWKEVVGKLGCQLILLLLLLPILLLLAKC